MLDPVDLRAAQVLNSRVQARLASVERATTPLYHGSLENPTPCGCAVLLSVGEHRFAVTAAHVVDKSDLSSLYLGSSTRPVRMFGTKITTKVGAGQSREDDQLDVAAVRLDAETTVHLNDEEFIGVQQLDAGRYDLDDEILLVAGYPGSRRRDIPSDQRLEVILYPFLACSRPRNTYERLGRDPERYFALGFAKKRLWRDAVRVIAPDLHEMSGCGVWSLYDRSGGLFDRPRLVGTLTEWHR